MSSAAGPGFEFEGLHRSFSECGDGYVDACSMAVIFDDEGVVTSVQQENKGATSAPLSGLSDIGEPSSHFANRSLFLGGTLGWFVPGD
jgi:hypothetical protein